MRHIVLEKGDCLFLPSEWIHFVYTPDESIAYGCNFIMEKHLYKSALAFRKELKEGFDKQFSFPHFGPLVVVHLYREWSNRHSSHTVSKDDLRKMLNIIKEDDRLVGTFPFERPWEEFLFHYALSVTDLRWDEIENWLNNEEKNEWREE